MIRPSELPSSEALAYLGDAIFSLYVRRFLVARGISHAGELNHLAERFVTAPRQAEIFRMLEGRLTEEEADIFKRAFNHKGLKHPKHASGKDYRTATGLEALLGALYLTGQNERIEELLCDVLTISPEDI